MNTAPNTGKLTLPGTKEELTEQERIRRGLLADGRPRKAGYGEAEQNSHGRKSPVSVCFGLTTSLGEWQTYLRRDIPMLKKMGSPYLAWWVKGRWAAA